MPSKSTKNKIEPQTGAADAPLTVHAQYVKDLSFENPTPLEHAKNSEIHPEINININVQATPIKDRTYEVALHITANAQKGKNTMFVVELQYGGVFTLGEMVEQNNIGPILMIECPRLLFPYARAVLSDVTREGGYPPLNLHPIDFVELYRRQYANKPAAEDKTKH